jgi:hypothetical protein
MYLCCIGSVGRRSGNGPNQPSKVDRREAEVRIVNAEPDGEMVVSSGVKSDLEAAIAKDEARSVRIW